MTLPAALSTAAGAAGVITVRGHDEIASFDREIDALAVRCGAPATARWAWMWPTLMQAGAHATANLVIGKDGNLAAAALLVHDDAHGHRQVSAAGGGDGHRAPLLAVDDDAAGALATAVVTMLAHVDGPLRLSLGPLPATDATAHRLRALLPAEAVATTETVPLVRRTGSIDVEDYLSDGTRRTLRKSRNRLRADGLASIVHRTRDRDRIAAALHDVAEVSRRRDHAGGRTSLLDDVAGRRRWERRIVGLASFVDVELSTLLIGDEPAAYVVGIDDGAYYRVLEGRFVMHWARYSPGRLLEADVLQRVLRDDRIDALDWMTSVAPDRLLCANDSESVVTLDALL